MHGQSDTKIKLIFNPNAGSSRKSRTGVGDVIRALQALGYAPEAWLADHGCDLRHAVREALEEGFKTFAVCGGDGTVSRAAGELAGTGATLAIIPTGTRNNIARSIGIPDDVDSAASTLKTGRRVLMDTGVAELEGTRMAFAEMCAAGLAAAISPPGEAVRDGDLSSIGEFLKTLVTSEPSKIEIVLDGGLCYRERGHVALVANTTFVGLNFQVCPAGCQYDGLLNVLHFADLSKIDLVKYITGGVYEGKPEDPRIQHFTARTVDIRTDPPMPVMLDGSVVGEGPVHIEIRPQALAVMAP